MTGSTPSTIRRALSSRKAPGGVWSSGVPGRIVDLDLPAAQLDRDPAREMPIGRDQGGGAPRLLEHAAQAHRERQGLGGEVRKFLEMEPRGRGRRDRLLVPGADRRGRPHHLAQQQGPCRIGAAELRARPVGHVRTLDLQGVEQLLQAILRMAGAELAPGRLVQLTIEAGQHDGASWQPRDHFQQGARAGNAAGGACRHDALRWRRAAPMLGEAGQQVVAALGRVERAFPGQQRGPGLGDHAQDLAARLPVLRQLVRHQLIEPFERDLLGLQLVEQERQLACKAQRVLLAAGHGGQQAGQQQLAAQRADRGRQRQVDRAREEQLVGLDLADRLDARQQQGLAVRLAHERLAQAAAGAPGRQQHQHVRERWPVVTDLGQQPCRQGIHKGKSRRDRGDRHHGAIYHGARRLAS